ncbi:M16 family metallopeptidase [Bacteroidota bacterium]
MSIDRSRAPEEKGIISFQLPDIRNLILSNGLKIMFVQKDNLPIVQLNLVISAGSKYDLPGKNGLACLTSSLIDEGAGKYSALELDDEIEKLGSVLSTSVDHDTALISMMSLKDNIERSVELLSMVIADPNFTKDDFNREQEKLLTKIIQLKDDPSYIANSSFDRILFENTAYSRPSIGTEASIRTITNDDAKEYYKKYFTVENSSLAVVGNLTEEELLVLLEKYFSRWNRGGKIKYPVIKKEKEATKLYIIHREDSAQSEIRVGHLSSGRNSEDFFAKSIMNSILGGQFSSRINLNLREDKGFTYGANSSFYYRKELSSFAVSTAVQNENTGAAVREILNELKGIKDNIEQDELNFAKSSQIKSFPLAFETYSQIARNLAHLIIHSLPNDYFNTYIDNLEKQTLEEVLKSARENIFTAHLCILVVGDKNIISDQLKKTTGLEPIELDLSGNTI